MTITALIGQDSFGLFILQGLQRGFRSEIMVGVIGSLLLAVTVDLLLAGTTRLLTPWSHRRTAP